MKVRFHRYERGVVPFRFGETHGTIRYIPGPKPWHVTVNGHYTRAFARIAEARAFVVDHFKEKQ